MFNPHFSASANTGLDLSGSLHSIYADDAKQDDFNVDDALIAKLLEDMQPLFHDDQASKEEDDERATMKNTLYNSSLDSNAKDSRHHNDNIWDFAVPLSDPLSASTSTASPSTAYLYHRLKHSLLNEKDGSLNESTYRYIKNILTARREQALNEQKKAIPIAELTHTSFKECLETLFHQRHDEGESEGEESDDEGEEDGGSGLRRMLRQRRKVLALLQQREEVYQV